MQHLISGQNRHEYADLLDQMHLLRGSQFFDRRKWRVTVENGRERDAFDDLEPLYCVVSDGHGKLLASTRVLMTMGPHMLADVFPDVMGGEEPLRHPLAWEVSRFCVDTKSAKETSSDGVNTVTRELLHCLFTAAHKSGITDLVAVHDVFMERILKRAGCEMSRLGPIVLYDDGLKTMGSHFEVSQRIVDRMAAPSPRDTRASTTATLLRAA
jgi:N-acyl-L-homoserine lactone synthetase